MNRLILGDNLEILKTLDDESVDLVYLDPPFFSNRNYEVIWGDAGEIRSFEDRWAGGIDHYIAWLKANVPRLEKDWQSVLHCDWHADAYIRTEILDNFFGMKNSRNAIVWHYTGWNKKLSDSFEKRHDIIFYYAKKNNTAQFNGYSKPWESEEEYIKKRKQKVHKNRHGAYVLSDGGNGQRVKRYLKEAMEYGSPVDDVWDFGKINNSSKERIGYPTQKPEALMERIIKCASKPGDIVLDPFMGGGTTMAVADKLHRQWIGIDQSVTAVKVTELRLDKQGATFEVIMQKNRESKMLNKTFQEFSTVALTYERSPKGAIRTIFFVGHCPTLGYKTPSWLNCLSKHTIAVKVVNHEGLESVEIVRLKVNGKIKKL